MDEQSRIELPGRDGQLLCALLRAESLSLVIKNQVEMRAMLNNIPIRLRNSKSCTREAVLRPLFRERVSCLTCTHALCELRAHAEHRKEVQHAGYPVAWLFFA